jgi:TatD DNase family protein
MGIPADQRGYTAFAHAGWYMERVATGEAWRSRSAHSRAWNCRPRKAQAPDADRFHCHLIYEGLVDRQAEALAAARARGVRGFLNISTRQREWEEVVAVAHREPDVWASVGIHPHEADGHADLGAAVLAAATADPRVIGIGETGLDYYYDHSDRQVQQDLFRVHIAVARETGLPLIIHTRDAEDDTLRILTEEMGKGAFPA